MDKINLSGTPHEATASLKDFQIVKKLGDGAYSSVYKVRRLSDNQIYALK